MFVDRHNPPYRVAGAVLVVITAVLAGLIYMQFRGDFIRSTELTLVSPRAGLVVERGAKVTYNGVEIGRVARIGTVDVDGRTNAQLSLDVDPDYVRFIPVNVFADVQATTGVGNMYVWLRSPAVPTAQRISSSDVIAASSVSTEFNTLFETVLSLAEQVDPVKLNQTLTATAEALTGLGDRFGASLTNGNAILDDLNVQMPQIREDTRLVTGLVDVYADASPDLWDGLENAVTTARTFNAQWGDVEAALMAALGFADTAADTLNRGGPYFVRGAEDLLPTSKLFDTYSPQLFCTLRNFDEIEKKVAETLGGNGYSLATSSGTFAGAGNPYIYPDNLPRVNARGGPEGRPGCWQKISRNLWPAPYLVMDTGASLAPYNHFELGQPLANEYVWGRQYGEYTINP